METNYYRVPTEGEMEERRKGFLERMSTIELSPVNIERKFRLYGSDDQYSWESSSPWEDFIDGSSVHLGKRSGGWKFLWNFHQNEYYRDKESLLSFIRSGRIVNEYGEEIPPDDFIEMALSWGQPDGWDTQTYYAENPTRSNIESRYYDIYVDGLRISTATEFS